MSLYGSVSLGSLFDSLFLWFRCLVICFFIVAVLLHCFCGVTVWFPVFNSETVLFCFYGFTVWFPVFNSETVLFSVSVVSIFGSLFLILRLFCSLFL